jgi:carbon monoxide dehydrogenase subunit G
MEMTGEQYIQLPQQRVWEALNDPAVLKDCIAGCESIDRVSDQEFRIAMTAAVGPVKAKFTGKLRMGDLNPPNSYALSFDGSGGGAGFGKGTAKVALTPDGDGTRLVYQANATVGGKLAQIGSRLVDGVARKMADDFFVRFKEKLSPPVDVLPAQAAMPAPPASAQATQAVPVWAWIAGGVCFLLIVLIFSMTK